MTKKQILKRANQLQDMLSNLQGKFKNLALKIRHEYDGDDLEDLEGTLLRFYNNDELEEILVEFDKEEVYGKQEE